MFFKSVNHTPIFIEDVKYRIILLGEQQQMKGISFQKIK